MRLNAFLAKAGVSSRRTADKLIKAGLVTVNGQPARLNDDVTEADKVFISNQQVKLRKSRYILLHKPAGYITTTRDPQGRPKVSDLVKISEKISPVGRLDKDTTGALLLTNDGPLAHRLMHPSFEIDKVYEAEVQGKISPQILQKLSDGVHLEDGKTAPAKVRKLSANRIELIVHEGRKHQVKRMLAAVGLKTLKLHRRQYGLLYLGGLKPGEWRDLAENELSKLM